MVSPSVNDIFWARLHNDGTNRTEYLLGLQNWAVLLALFGAEQIP